MNVEPDIHLNKSSRVTSIIQIFDLVVKNNIKINIGVTSLDICSLQYMIDIIKWYNSLRNFSNTDIGITEPVNNINVANHINLYRINDLETLLGKLVIGDIDLIFFDFHYPNDNLTYLMKKYLSNINIDLRLMVLTNNEYEIDRFNKMYVYYQSRTINLTSLIELPYLIGNTMYTFNNPTIKIHITYMQMMTFDDVPNKPIYDMIKEFDIWTNKMSKKLVHTYQEWINPYFMISYYPFYHSGAYEYYRDKGYLLILDNQTINNENNDKKNEQLDDKIDDNTIQDKDYYCKFLFGVEECNHKNRKLVSRILDMY